MKKCKIYLITFIVLVFHYFKAQQTPNWEWAKTANAKGAGTAVTTDNSGNVYTLSNYGVPNFIFGAFTLNTYSSFSGNCALSKIDASGNIIWCVNIGLGNQSGISLAVDATNNIYVVGENYGSINKVFLSKFDSGGNSVWTKTTTCTYYSHSKFLTIDGSGNIIICGYFNGTQMDFSTTTSVISSDPTTNTTAIFLAKYNSNGTVLWAKTFPGNANHKGAVPTGIGTDGAGNIYMCGWFSCPTLNFSNNVVTNTGNNESVFITKLNSNGVGIWARSIGGGNSDQANSIAVDNSGNTYLSGSFRSASLTIGTTTLVNTNTNWYWEDLFLIKYNSNGNVLWAKSKDGSKITSSGIDATGNVYVGGSLRDSIIFAGHQLKGGNNFFAKYDANGNEVWGKNISTISGSYANYTNAVYLYSLSPKISTSLYVTGSYDAKKLILDSCSVVNSDTTGNSQAFFVSKIGSTFVGINESTLDQNLSVFPNPSEGRFFIKREKSISNPFSLKLFNIAGQEVPFTTILQNDQIEIIFSFPQTGIYFLELTNKNIRHQNKLIIY